MDFLKDKIEMENEFDNPIISNKILKAGEKYNGKHLYK